MVPTVVLHHNAAPAAAPPPAAVPHVWAPAYRTGVSGADAMIYDPALRGYRRVAGLRLLDLRTGRVVRSVTADAAAYFRVVPLQGDPPPGAIVL